MKKKRKSNVILIQNEHQIKITATKNQSVKTRIIETQSMNVMTRLNFMKIKSGINNPKKKQINVYASKTCVLNDDYDKNVFIKHKFLTKGIYLFEPIRQKNETLKTYLSTTNSMMTKKTNFIFMTNLKKIQTKIVKKQLIGRLKQIEIFKQTSEVYVNFDYANVFIGKHIENESIDSTNFFVIGSKNSNVETINLDINEN